MKRDILIDFASAQACASGRFRPNARSVASRFFSFAVCSLTILFAAASFGGSFVITPSYQASVPAAAQTAFTNLKARYENLYANAATVKVDIRFVGADPVDFGGAASSTGFITMTYANWKADMGATSTLFPTNTYLSAGNGTLPNADPIGNSTVEVRTANARAIGVTNGQVTGGTAGLLNPAFDSTLTFYYDNTGGHTITDTWDFGAAGVAGKLNFNSFASHELNEALGIGSSLTGINNNAAAPGQYEAYDYYRFDSLGNRFITTDPTAAVYFSYDYAHAGAIDRFNQDKAFGDRNDWIWGNFGGPAATVEVQNAVGYAGQAANLIDGVDPTFPTRPAPEFIALSTIGYSVPEPSSLALLSFGLVAFVGGMRQRMKN